MLRKVKTYGRKNCVETKRRIRGPESSSDDFESTFDRLQRSVRERNGRAKVGQSRQPKRLQQSNSWNQKSIRNAIAASSSSDFSSMELFQSFSKTRRNLRKVNGDRIQLVNYSSSLNDSSKAVLSSKRPPKLRKKETSSGSNKENKAVERQNRRTAKKMNGVTKNFKQNGVSQIDDSITVLEVINSKKFSTRTSQRLRSNAASLLANTEASEKEGVPRLPIKTPTRKNTTVWIDDHSYGRDKRKDQTVRFACSEEDLFTKPKGFGFRETRNRKRNIESTPIERNIKHMGSGIDLSPVEKLNLSEEVLDSTLDSSMETVLSGIYEEEFQDEECKRSEPIRVGEKCTESTNRTTRIKNGNFISVSRECGSPSKIEVGKRIGQSAETRRSRILPNESTGTTKGGGFIAPNPSITENAWIRLRRIDDIINFYKSGKEPKNMRHDSKTIHVSESNTEASLSNEGKASNDLSKSNMFSDLDMNSSSTKPSVIEHCSKELDESSKESKGKALPVPGDLVLTSSLESTNNSFDRMVEVGTKGSFFTKSDHFNQKSRLFCEDNDVQVEDKKPSSKTTKLIEESDTENTDGSISELRNRLLHMPSKRITRAAKSGGSVESRCSKDTKDEDSMMEFRKNVMAFPRNDKLSRIRCSPKSKQLSTNKEIKGPGVQILLSPFATLKNTMLDRSDKQRFCSFSESPISCSLINNTVEISTLGSLPVIAKPGKARRRSHLQMVPASLVEGTLDDSVHMDAEQRVLKRCKYNYPVDMHQHFHQGYVKCMKKIGEGVYSEVFSHNLGDVVKVMPIEGSLEINDAKQKQFHEVLSEVIISMELSHLRYGTAFKTDGFVELKASYCLKGQYTPELLQLWDNYDDVKQSENDRPDVFDDQQMYLVLQFENAGTDLEGYTFTTAAQACSIFLQITHSVAVAETCLEFEHRDLHWGNVLLSKTKEKHVTYKINNMEIPVETEGLKVTIIDYTLSRMKYKDYVVFNDLEDDKSLFRGKGDYQFEIYREMRKETRKDWKKFCPKTNILWLHYLLDKLINECRYRNKRLKKHQESMKLLIAWHGQILDYSSSLHLISQLAV